MKMETKKRTSRLLLCPKDGEKGKGKDGWEEKGKGKADAEEKGKGKAGAEEKGKGKGKAEWEEDKGAQESWEEAAGSKSTWDDKHAGDDQESRGLRFYHEILRVKMCVG